MFVICTGDGQVLRYHGCQSTSLKDVSDVLTSLGAGKLVCTLIHASVLADLPQVTCRRAMSSCFCVAASLFLPCSMLQKCCAFEPAYVLLLLLLLVMKMQ